MCGQVRVHGVTAGSYCHIEPTHAWETLGLKHTGRSFQHYPAGSFAA